MHHFHSEQWLDRPLEEVFAFFSDANNLEAITPRQLNFRILTPGPLRLEVGARIDYQLTLYGVPLKWATLIERWEPPREFVDVQLRGPYRVWRHTHRFLAEGKGTRMIDDSRLRTAAGAARPNGGGVMGAARGRPDIRLPDGSNRPAIFVD